ncbi:bifunctional aldehyde dehydrogenase/enoyl-CoA hydratase [Klebsiella variicola]|nr:bifunctional aldehyde dehydrogenase/enoyl-CoA hydratase [Klebsiella variicola]
MQQLASYLSGAWQTGRGAPVLSITPSPGAALWEVTSEGLDMAQARRFAIERGGKALQAMTFIERSAMLKAVAKRLLEKKDEFYAISAQTGATRADSWVDIEGGIGTLFTYAGLGSRELPDDILWPEDELIPLSKQGGFCRASRADLEIRRRRPYQRLQLPLLGNAGKTGAGPGLPACRRSLNRPPLPPSLPRRW